MQEDKTDAELIKAVEEADQSTQEQVAINLAKIDRFDIISAVNVPGLLEKLQGNPEWQKVIAGQQGNDMKAFKDGDWAGSSEAKNLWDNNKSIQEEFENNFESYLAYCKAMDLGYVKVNKNSPVTTIIPPGIN